MCYSFLVGGREGNASCTLALLRAVCGTPVRLALADGSLLPAGRNCRPTYPLNPPHYVLLFGFGDIVKDT